MTLTADIAAMHHPGLASSISLGEKRDVAERLEASFLAEMLKHGGLGLKESTIGTGDESQFASFHRDALALQIVRSGGLGLADLIFKSLMERPSDK